LSCEGGHHASRSSTSNVVHTHGHWKNKSSEAHVPSSSPPTSAKASPSGCPPSPNTYNFVCACGVRPTWSTRVTLFNTLEFNFVSPICIITYIHICGAECPKSLINSPFLSGKNHPGGNCVKPLLYS